MKERNDFHFEISISEKSYRTKPSSEDYKCMKFHKVVVNPGMFMEYIRLGYSYCHVYKNDYRSNKTFLYTYFVNIDVDDSQISMSQCINRAVIKPTLAYTTFSNMKNGLYSYRLIYCFSEQIDAQIYEPLYKKVCAYANLSATKDNCGRVLAQLMNGNSLPDMESYLSNRIYEISDFAPKGSLQLYVYGDRVYNSNETKNTNYSNSKESNKYYSYKITLDLRNLESKSFLDKYSYLGIVDQTKLDYNEKGYCIIPESFYKVYNRIVWSDKQARIKPFKDGEGRHKRLFADACVIRKIEPEITFEKMLYNLVYRRNWFYDNSDHTLTNTLLIEIAKQVLAKPLSDMDNIQPSKHGKFATSWKYCRDNKINRRSYARKIQKDLNYKSIGEWYDLSLSVSENLEYANQNGIQVSSSTLRRFCKDQDIDVNPHRKPIETWYNPAVSVKANLQRAKLLGINASRNQLYKYCKKNNINPKGIE